MLGGRDVSNKHAVGITELVAMLKELSQQGQQLWWRHQRKGGRSGAAERERQRQGCLKRPPTEASCRSGSSRSQWPSIDPSARMPAPSSCVPRRNRVSK
mmetsp:Transcript_323/g.1045  ORF Transcript_323/g.1045 Transcript_323/m.1045 type:complete len:99 (+) Transcript_323:304-600(+)